MKGAGVRVSLPNEVAGLPPAPTTLCRGSVHRHQMLARSRLPAALPLRRLLSTKAIPPPKLFDYATVTSHIHVSDAISAVEAAFGALARGKVDVPFPMHIGIDETASAGPGDCHIKGGYVSGESTWTVKLACVSFYKNVADGLPPGGGIFVVMNAKNGAPLAVIQENRFLTDVRTGAAGGISVKYLTKPTDKARPPPQLSRPGATRASRSPRAPPRRLASSAPARSQSRWRAPPPRCGPASQASRTAPTQRWRSPFATRCGRSSGASSRRWGRRRSSSRAPRSSSRRPPARRPCSSARCCSRAAL